MLPVEQNYLFHHHFSVDTQGVVSASDLSLQGGDVMD